MPENTAAPVTQKLPNWKDYKIAEGDNRFLLPGGLSYNGRLLRRVKMRPTNGYDEEAVGTSEVSSSGWRTTDVLLNRTIESIEDIKDPNAIEQLVPLMFVGDRIALLFMLEKISSGDQRRINFRCPRGHDIDYLFDIDKIVYDAYEDGPPANITATLPDPITVEGVPHKTVRLRLPIGRDEKELQQVAENDGLLRSRLLDLCCGQLGELNRPLDPVLIRGTSSRNRAAMNKTIEAYSPGPKLRVDVTCPQHGITLKGLVQPQNFFGG